MARWRWIWLAAGLALAAAPTARAQAPKTGDAAKAASADDKKARALFKDAVAKFDAGDWAGAVALFETLELNSDGQLVFEEFDSSDRKRDALGRMFHTLDRNGDGLLEWTEVRGR